MQQPNGVDLSSGRQCRQGDKGRYQLNAFLAEPQTVDRPIWQWDSSAVDVSRAGVGWRRAVPVRDRASRSHGGGDCSGHQRPPSTMNMAWRRQARSLWPDRSNGALVVLDGPYCLAWHTAVSDVSFRRALICAELVSLNS